MHRQHAVHRRRRPGVHVFRPVQRRAEYLGRRAGRRLHDAEKRDDGEQVWDLLGATIQAADSGKKPVITMAMGQLGCASRILGELSGSCITFGTAGQSSAPGQMEVGQLKEILWALRLDGDEEK